MHFRFRPVWSCLAVLLACVLPLTAAEKKPGRKTADTTLSPDGHYQLKLEIVNSSEGGREKTATLIDTKTGATLLDLESTGAPWLEDNRVLWSPGSRRLAYVTGSRRGDWTHFIVHNGDKWEEVDLPNVPGFNWKGHRSESKTILAAWSAVRWSGPDVLLIDNEVEDDEGHSAKAHYAFTFDAQNHITVKRLKK